MYFGMHLCRNYYRGRAVSAGTSNLVKGERLMLNLPAETTLASVPLSYMSHQFSFCDHVSGSYFKQIVI